MTKDRNEGSIPPNEPVVGAEGGRIPDDGVDASRPPSRVASPESTGGAGDTFEKLVGARYLADLLLERSLPGLACVVKKVKFQRRSEGHLYDDIVVEGAEMGADVQVKRSIEFVASDDESVEVMTLGFATLDRTDPEQEFPRRLTIVTRPSKSLDQVWKLSELARSKALEDFFKDMEGQDRSEVRDRLTKLRLLAEKARPDLDSSRRDLLLWRWLRSTAFRPFDDRPDSTDLVGLDNDLAGLLGEARDPVPARDLVNLLRVMVADLAKSAGTVLRSHVVRALPPHLRPGLPRSIGPTLRALKRESLESLRGIRSDAAGVALDRSALAAQVHAAASEQANVIIIAGAGGVGKSAIAKQVIEPRVADDTAVALSLRRIRANTLVELERVLGLEVTVPELLASMSAGTETGMLMLDSAEYLLSEERRELGAELLRLLAQRDIVGPWQLLLTIREHAMEPFQRLLTTCWPQSRVTTITVPHVTDEEWSHLLDGHPILRDLSVRGASAVLRRSLFTLDWVVRTRRTAAPVREIDAPSSSDPPMSEAAVVQMLWESVIRLDEGAIPGRGSADEREQTILALARHSVEGRTPTILDSAPAVALEGLRGDGIIVRSMSGDDYAHDKLRDWGIAKLLLASRADLSDLAQRSWDPTVGPAVRLWFEMLILAGNDDVWRRRAMAMGELGAPPRWIEYPYEGLVRNAQRDAYDRNRTMLMDGRVLPHLIAAIEQRALLSDGSPDPRLWSPAITFLCMASGEAIAGSPRAVLRVVRHALERGIPIESEAKARVGNAALEALDRDIDSEARRDCVAAIALLADTLKERGFVRLRTELAAHPRNIGRILEQPAACGVLARANASALRDLARDYYCLEPGSDEYEHSGVIRPEGLRRFVEPFPMVWAFKGPFFILLRVDLLRGLELVGSVVDAATKARLPVDADPEYGPTVPVEIEWPGLGRRRYLGSDQVYRWYRGTGVGPYPALSALAALEIAMDASITEGLSLGDAIRLLLESSESLAIVGVCVGLLAAHLPRVRSELDPFLRVPLLWRMETARMGREHEVALLQSMSFGAFEIPKSAPPPAAHRRWTMRELAQQLVALAIVNSDTARQEELRRIGATLVNADRRGFEREPITDDDRLVLRIWAADLDASLVKRETTPDGEVFRIELPSELAAARDASLADGDWIGTMMSMAMVGAQVLSGERSESLDTLLSSAKRLREETVLESPIFRSAFMAAKANVAAAILLSDQGKVEVGADPELRAWCAEALLEAASQPPEVTPFGVIPQSVLPFDADRAAARGLVALVELDGPRAELTEAMLALSRSPYHEVRGLLIVSASALVEQSPALFVQLAENVVSSSILPPLAGAPSRAASRRRSPKQGLVSEVGRALRALVAREARSPTSAATAREELLWVLRQDHGARVDRLGALGVVVAARNLLARKLPLPPGLREVLDALLDWDICTRRKEPSAELLPWDQAVADLIAYEALGGDREHLDKHVGRWKEVPAMAAEALAGLLRRGVGTELEPQFVGLWPGLVRPIVDGLGQLGQIHEYGVDDLKAVLVFHIRFSTWKVTSWRPAASAPFLELLDGWVRNIGTWEGAVESLATYLTLAGDQLPPERGLSLLETLTNHPQNFTRGRLGLSIAWLKFLGGSGAAIISTRKRVVDRLAACGDRKALDFQRELESGA